MATQHCTGYANANEAILCWYPDSAKVKLVPFPDTRDECGDYPMTALACCDYVQRADFETRKKIVFIEAMHLIVRDGCDPLAVHRALLGLNEYRDGCALDMPGID